MRVRNLLLYAFVMISGTGLVLALKNPDLHTVSLPLRETKVARPPAYPVWTLGKSAPGPSARQYRGGADRRGVVDQEVKLPKRVRSVVPRINVGIHSASKSSAVVVGNLIITASDAGVLRAYRNDGTIAWTLRTLTAFYGFHSTPVVADGVVYVGDYAGMFYAVDLASGRPLWILPVGHAVGGTPLLDGESDLYINAEVGRPDGYILKVDRRSGRVLWRSAWFGEHSHASPALDHASGHLIFGDNNGIVRALDASTGVEKWRFATGGEVKNSPALYDGKAILSSWSGRIFALDIATGRELWRLPISEKNQSSAAIGEDGVGYINSARGICRFDARTGREIRCEDREASIWSKSASPVITRKLVWSACDGQSLCIYDPATLKRLRVLDLGASLTGELAFSETGSAWAVTYGRAGLVEID